jgi:hypothetical protein
MQSKYECENTNGLSLLERFFIYTENYYIEKLMCRKIARTKEYYYG